jgi:hypothetical protein
MHGKDKSIGDALMYYISFLFFSSSLYNRKKYIFSFGGITQLVGGMPYETKGINLNLSLLSFYKY